MHTIGKKILMLKPEDIKIAPYKPRKYFDRQSLEELTKSISSIGIIQPLIVRKNHKGKYLLISGEKRLRAAVILGLRRVPCVLHNINEQTAIMFSIAENNLRSSLNFYEEVKAINRLITYYGVSKTQLTECLGTKHSALAKKLNRLKLSGEICEKILFSYLGEEFADLLTEIPEFMRDETIDHIANNNLNIKQTENYIRNMLCPKEKIETQLETEQEIKPEKSIIKYSIGDTRIFFNSLKKLVDTLKNSGIDASTHRNETKKYTEYKVRIYKTTDDNPSAEQLKIC